MLREGKGHSMHDRKCRYLCYSGLYRHVNNVLSVAHMCEAGSRSNGGGALQGEELSSPRILVKG